MIKPIVKLLNALNGNLKKTQIAAGFSWGILLGLIPAGNVFWIVLFAVSFFFKNHHWSKLFAMAVVKVFLGALNPAIDAAGWEILHAAALQPLFISLYNMPFVPLTKFNNTLVAGGLCLGIGLWLPVFLLFMLFVPLYRDKLIPGLRKNKIYQKILKFPLFPVLGNIIKAATAGK